MLKRIGNFLGKECQPAQSRTVSEAEWSKNQKALDRAGGLLVLTISSALLAGMVCQLYGQQIQSVISTIGK